MLVIDSRVLKFTYGIKVFSPWKEGDPPERMMNNFVFILLREKQSRQREGPMLELMKSLLFITQNLLFLFKLVENLKYITHVIMMGNIVMNLE